MILWDVIIHLLLYHFVCIWVIPTMCWGITNFLRKMTKYHEITFTEFSSKHYSLMYEILLVHSYDNKFQHKLKTSCNGKKLPEPPHLWSITIIIRRVLPIRFRLIFISEWCKYRIENSIGRQLKRGDFWFELYVKSVYIFNVYFPAVSS